MLDKTSKMLIERLSVLPDNQFLIGDEPDISLDFGSGTDFWELVRFLEGEGYIEKIRDQHGHTLGIRLSHTGSHLKEFNKLKFWTYVKDKWIDFLALIVAVIALIISIAALSAK